jgi:MFS family permease
LLVSAFLWSLVTGAVYAVWANYMVGQVGYETAVMSRLWALASLSEFPLMIAAGWLSDRIGRLETLGVSFFAWAMVFGGYVALPLMPWIAGVQLLRGFAYSSFTATAMTYATEVRAKSLRGQTSGLYNSASALGAIVGATMGGTLAEFAGFRTMFVVNAVLICFGATYLAVAALRRGRHSVPVPHPASES